MVKIAEPMTMVTDYLITAFTVLLSLAIVGNISINENLGSWVLSFSLLFTGLAALFGGSAHGFKPTISSQTHDLLWRLTTYCVGIASYMLEIGVFVSSITNTYLLTGAIFLATIQLGGYLVWMWSHYEFKYVIVNYAVSMIIVVALKTYTWISISDPSSKWILGGILVSFLAAMIQATGFSLHDRYFNHNDLYHVVQLPGFYLIYRAALVLPVL